MVVRNAVDSDGAGLRPSSVTAEAIVDDKTSVGCRDGGEVYEYC